MLHGNWRRPADARNVPYWAAVPSTRGPRNLSLCLRSANLGLMGDIPFGMGSGYLIKFHFTC